MPGSSARDSSPDPFAAARKPARNRKSKKTAGVPPADVESKKEESHIREAGGVVAAVKKHAAKFTDGGTEPGLFENPPSRIPSPPPNLKPATPTIIPTHNNAKSAAATSPMLDAASSTSIATSTAPSMSDWAKTRGLLAGSPNLICLSAGESPPTQPSSYEDSGAMPYLWTQQQQQQQLHEQHQYYQPQQPQKFKPTSVSPPTSTSAIRRPLSYHTDPQFQSQDLRSQAPSPASGRRSSVNSPFPQGRLGAHPPLPHQPQPHFYNAPDLDFDMDSNSTLKPGERGYHCGFDTWPGPKLVYSPGSNNTVVTGHEGGLDVYSLTKRGLESLANLRGLRGGVHNAKILPWTSVGPHGNTAPMIAVVVHGPVLSVSTPELGVDPLCGGNSPQLDGLDTPQPDVQQRKMSVGKSSPVIEAYQTTVEVYCLRTNARVETLLQAPAIPVKKGQIQRAPPPTGAFQIRADDGHVVVSSGVTGETWVFRHFTSHAESGVEFRCIGKLWTSLQQGVKEDTTDEDENDTRPVRQNPQSPIFAIHGRWLAYCPAAPSSQIALNASVRVRSQGKATGLNTVTSPVLPSENTEVDQALPDGVMNRIMRETAQEMIQGARWVGKQGMHFWNNYWKPSPGPQASPRRPSVGSPPYTGYFNKSDASRFPPTYGISGQAVTKDPGLVSIVDLDTLEGSTSVHPVSTFKAPLGCSFLSFSPTGLSLFTATSKGDVQNVWDLMRIQYSKASPLQNTHLSQGNATRVRQIAQFSRMTVARIVDVAWSKPNGERVAMVTERGTVHIREMPSSAYTWPPPRRRVKTPEPSSETPTSAVSIASSALSSAYGAARPLINRRRRSNPTAQAHSSIMDHASYGGKVLAAGISHSLGNAGTAISHLRHNGENRVSLPPSNTTSGYSCVIWVTGKRHHTLYTVGNGIVRSFPSQKWKTSKERVRVPHGNKYRDFKLRAIPDMTIAPSIQQMMGAEEKIELAYRDHEGASTLVFNSGPRMTNSDMSPESSIPQAEIESNAPYQPFHTDRRVGISEYAVDMTQSSLVSMVDQMTLDESAAPHRSKSEDKERERPSFPSTHTRATPWAFGECIQTVKLDVGLPPVFDEDFSHGPDDHRALPASAIERVMEFGETHEQIVVTTRRRRGGNRVSGAEEDGFFEDDCEVLDFADQRV